MAATQGTAGTSRSTKVSFFTYLLEGVSGAAVLLQEAPVAVATEVAVVLQEVPVVGLVCKTFLLLEQLVETAKSNKGDLATLRDLCDVVINGVLEKQRSGRSGLLGEGFTKLQGHVERATEVATLCCGGRVKRLVLARKICTDIAAVRKDVLAFCTANNLVLADDIHARVDKLAIDLVDKLEAMKQLTVTQSDYDAMEKEVASMAKKLENMGEKVDAKEKASLDLEAELRSSKESLAAVETKLKAEVDNVADKENEWKATEHQLQAMKHAVASKTKELENRKKELEIREKSQHDLELELRSSIEALVATRNQIEAKVDKLPTDFVEKLEARQQLKFTSYLSHWTAIVSCLFVVVAVLGAACGYTSRSLVGSPDLGRQKNENIRTIEENASTTALEENIEKNTSTALKEEHRRVVDRASKVNIPRDAPHIRDWFIERKAIIDQACDRLGVVSTPTDASEESRIVGLAGPRGAGKSIVASMVVAREDVRAFFHEGVLWLPVGQGADNRISAVMFDLAEMVYETVLGKTCRPPRKGGLRSEPEDGAAYIRDVVDESNRRFLVVADDVWDVEVLEELEKAGVWVLYTSRDVDLLPEVPAIRLGPVLEEEAEMVLRRAVGLDDDAELPEAAYELMKLCEYGVMHLAFVGRWIHGRNDRRYVWQTVLDRIKTLQERGKGGRRGNSGQHLPWNIAVLHAGLEEPSYENLHNNGLYTSLAVIPKGLAFPWEVAAVLLYGVDYSTEDREAAGRVVASLERLSILTREHGGKYRVHNDHADFIQGRFAANQDARDRALPRWREYLSSVQALVSFSAVRLVEMWRVLTRVGGEDISSRPYDAALDAMDPSSADRPAALQTAARFAGQQKDWAGAYEKFSQLLEIQENTVGADHPDFGYTLQEIGVCVHSLGRTEEAWTLLRRALSILEEKPDVDQRRLALNLHNLGMCTYDIGKPEEAEQFLRRALTIREILGDNRDVAATRQELRLCAKRKEEMKKNSTPPALEVALMATGLYFFGYFTIVNILGKV